jgi:glycosyltransferase involved in cell wall biosynthesis
MHVVPSLGVGGLEQVVAALCAATDPARFECSVLCLNSVGEIGERLRDEGYPVFDVGRKDGRPNYLAFMEAARVLRRERIDVVHSHNTQAFVDGSLGAKLAGVERIVHSDHARLFPDKRRWLFAEWIVSHFAHRVVAVSDHTAAELRRHVGIAARKLVTIPNGIVGDPFDRRVEPGAKRRELQLEGMGPVLGIGARLEAQKAHADLLEAVGILTREFPDLVLLICGDGSLAEDLKEQARRLGIERNVRFLGVRFDMPELLRAFDLYVLPSIWEGLPMALIEAMAAGCPIVASRVGGVPMAVIDGVTGTTVPPSQPAELARAVAELLRDPERMGLYARNGRRLFEERFTVDHMARAYEALYLGN